MIDVKINCHWLIGSDLRLSCIFVRVFLPAVFVKYRYFRYPTGCCCLAVISAVLRTFQMQQNEMPLRGYFSNGNGSELNLHILESDRQS